MADSGGSAATDAALAEFALEHMFDWAAVSSSMASMYVPHTIRINYSLLDQ